MSTEDSIRQSFRRSLREVKSLPTLPGIVLKLTEMAESPETTSEQMGRMIARDHILAVKLLKLVNSAFYGFPQRIGSLPSALILLGFNVIKGLIISASIFEIMEEQDAELWEHSLACAVASGVIARHLKVADPEEVSTAGLIHDLGKVAIKMELPTEHALISKAVEERQISRLTAEREILHLDHAEAGGWLAKTWNLPAKLVEPIFCHHTPEQATTEPVASAIVHFSDILVRGMGCGHGQDIWVPPLSPAAWMTLNLTQNDLDTIIEETSERLWDVKGFTLDLLRTPADNTTTPDESSPE